MAAARARRDDVELVLLAASANDLDPHEVLASADMAALARCAAAVEAAAPGAEAASVALVEVLRRRPFAAGNRAAAALACAYLLADAGGRTVADDVLVELVQAVEAGEVATATDAAAVLAEAGASGRRALPWPCPACGRRLHVVDDRRGRRTLVSHDPTELRARCAQEHGVHDRSGRAVAPPERRSTERWAPVLQEPAGGAGSLLVLATDGPLLLTAVAAGWAVSRVGDLPVSALVGRWSGLGADGSRLGEVDADAVVLDGARSHLDVPRLLDALAVVAAPVAS